jgi:hypothetical protein
MALAAMALCNDLTEASPLISSLAVAFLTRALMSGDAKWGSGLQIGSTPWREAEGFSSALGKRRCRWLRAWTSVGALMLTWV